MNTDRRILESPRWRHPVNHHLRNGLGVLIAVMLAVPLLVRAGDDEAEPAFAIHITDYDGAAGYGRRYDLSPDQIVVTGLSDWNDEKPRELLRQKLTEPQTQSVIKFLKRFPLEKLETKYEAPHIFDGYQLTFDIQIAGRGQKTIKVHHIRQRDLQRLCREINRILPREHQMSYAEW